jgi:hypothetical protein
MELTAEEHVDALINEQECRAVPFFVVDTCMRPTCSRGDFPVDVADIVSWDVGTELTEVETPAAQTRSVRARELAMNRQAGEEGEFACLSP